MLAIQENQPGIPVLIESVPGEDGRHKFQEVTGQRWREIISEVIDPSETDRAIIPIHPSDARFEAARRLEIARKALRKIRDLLDPLDRNDGENEAFQIACAALNDPQ